MATIAAAPVAAKVIAGVTSVTSIAAGIMEGGDLQRQGEATARAAEYNAAQAATNAAQAREQGELDMRRRRMDALLDLGEMRALFGASGVDLVGSPLDVLESDARIAETDALFIRHQAELKAQAFEREAELERQRAAAAREAGKKAKKSSTILGGLKGIGNAIGRILD